MESVASTLDFIRKQSAARRSDFNERWKVDVDVNRDVDEGGTSSGSDDDKGWRSHFAMPSISSQEVAPRQLVGADDPSPCIGDHKYEYAVSPTTSTSAAILSSATTHRTHWEHQRCVVDYFPPGNAATTTDFTIGSQERSVSSYVRATATDASVYSRASYSDYSLPSSVPTTRSTTDRLHRAGSLLQGLSYAELDLPVNADAVDRLRSKLNRLSSENGGASQSRVEAIGAKIRSTKAHASIGNCPVPSIVDCIIAGDSASAVDTITVASFPTRPCHLPHPSSRPLSAMSVISSASRFSASTSTTASSKKRPHPTSCVFDPSMMQGSRRAALKAAKRAKDEVAAKAEERRMRLFKARPLPCGGTVTSNLFAPTMASTNARASGMANMHSNVSTLTASLITGNCSRPGTGHSRASRASFSSLPASLSRHSSMNSRNRTRRSDARSTCSFKSGSPLRSSPSPTAVKRRNAAKRRKILAEIDEEIRTEMDVAIVPYDVEFANDNDNVSVASDGNDMSTLQHELAILEAQLRQTRSYNERTLDEIEALDNLQGIDCMTITFDKDDENTKGRGQKYACNEVPRDIGAPLRPSSAIIINSSGSACNDSLYHRQEKWASAVEMRLENARLKRADDLMSGFTGKPQITTTGDSWKRAKAAHDAVIQRVSEEQERNEVRRGGHEKKEEEETAVSPSSKLEEEGSNTNKSNTKSVDWKRQADYAERLARPRSIASPHPSVTEKGGDSYEIDTENKLMVQKSPFLPSSDGKQTVKTSRQTPTIDDLLTKVDTSASNGPRKNHASNVPNTKSFADMNDKEFSHIMRRLGIKSIPKTQGEKKSKKARATTTSFATLDDETASKLPLEAYLGSSPKSNGKRPPRSPPTGGDRFVSSEAQANVFKKIRDQERDAVANKMKGPAKCAGSAFLDNGRSQSSIAVTNPQSCYHELGDENSRDALDVASRSSNLVSCTDTTSSTTSITEMKPFEEPYQRYEAGQAPFFDQSSSDKRGRFRVRDASSFDPTSMRRIVGPDSETDDGVMLLVGEKYDESGYRRKEYAITILFDRRKWKEEDAEQWWRTQRHRFVDVS